MTEMTRRRCVFFSSVSERGCPCRICGLAAVSRFIVLAVLGMALTAVFFPVFLSGETRRGAPSSVPDAGGNFCWILINIESFFCSPCLQPLLDFCRALPVHVQEERVKGILVSDGPEGENHADRRMLIVRKKWQGFKRANNIRFPAAVDSGHFYRGLLKSVAVVLLFDDEKQVLKSYPFPLKQGQLDEITGFLLK